MRHILFTFLTGLLFCASIAAQSSGFSQNGKVTQELQAEGLCIAHSALPLNSKARVVNIATGKEIEVTVTRRIPASLNRIADLSPGAWRELALTPTSEVRIYTNAFLRQTGGTGGPETDSLSESQPLNSGNDHVQNLNAPHTSPVSANASINIYNVPPVKTEDSSNSSNKKLMSWLATMIYDSKDTRETREMRRIREEREAREARELREIRVAREAREDKEIREAREARELREIREAREAREKRELREIQEAREARELREIRESREALEALDYLFR